LNFLDAFDTVLTKLEGPDGISLVIPSRKQAPVAVSNSVSCPVKCEVILSSEIGLSKARNSGVRKSIYPFVVMVDDDVTLLPEGWAWLMSLRHGEFALAKVGNHLSSRTFAIWRDDFWYIGGFDESFKYVFEDGDFAIRAKKAGLHLKIMPSSFFVHHEHKRGFRFRNLAALDFEYTRVLVKYKREVFSNLFEFFWRPFDWRIKFQDLIFKTVFMVYWIIRDIA
jgi:GT2 family glycosyltransferase